MCPLPPPRIPSLPVATMLRDFQGVTGVLPLGSPPPFLPLPHLFLLSPLSIDSPLENQPLRSEEPTAHGEAVRVCPSS